MGVMVGPLVLGTVVGCEDTEGALVGKLYGCALGCEVGQVTGRAVGPRLGACDGITSLVALSTPLTILTSPLFCVRPATEANLYEAGTAVRWCA